MKIDRGNQGIHHIPTDGTALNDASFCMALLCILVQYAKDKTMSFSQSDFDNIHGMFLAEGYDLETGDFLIKLMTRKEVGVQDN